MTAQILSLVVPFGTDLGREFDSAATFLTSSWISEMVGIFACAGEDREIGIAVKKNSTSLIYGTRRWHAQSQQHRSRDLRRVC